MQDLSSVLAQTDRVLKELGPDFDVERRRLQELSERLAQGRFHLAVLGQFKRGKSTLLNAFLGEHVLPAAVVPLTSIPTFLRSGVKRQARVLFLEKQQPGEFSAHGAEELCAYLCGYVTESANPKNTLGVREVEVVHPADILRQGMVLIDTPGIGSTFRHNTEATLNFLAQCDAAMFVVSADPPITEVEVEFLKQVRRRVSRLFFVLNKVDYLRAGERREALEFLQKVLSEQAGIADAAVMSVSARQGLEARQRGDPDGWRNSGLEQLERYLIDFLRNEKFAVLQEALARKARDVLEEVTMKLRLAVRSLEMPLDDLRQRLGIFEQKLTEIQRERVAASDLMAGDRRRTHEFLAKHTEAFRVKLRGYLKGIVEETVAKDGDNLLMREDAVREALAEAIPGYCEHHAGETTSLLSRRVADVLSPHQQRAEQLIASVRKAAAELFDVPYHAPESAGAFVSVDQPYWVTHQWDVSLRLLPPGFWDHFLPPLMRRRRLQKRLMDQMDTLITRNIENLRWTAYQSIDETFRRFGWQLDERLAQTIVATHGAVQAAMAKRRQHSAIAADEIIRLQAATAAVLETHDRLRMGTGT